jgi:hypothetical protein
MKYAWIENEIIRDICQGGNPEDCYTPNVAAYYDTLVPDEAVNGDGWVNNTLVPTPPAPEPEPAPRTWNSSNVRDGLTLAEKAKWDSNATPEIATAKVEFQDAKNLADTTEVLNFLVSSASISQASMDKILA